MVSIRDFCQQDRATQTELRRVGVRMVHEGHTRIEAAAAVGVNWHSVGLWVAAVARSGEKTLVSAGPAAGRTKSAVAGTGNPHQAADQRDLPGSSGSAVRAMDARGGWPADRAR